VVTSLTLKSRAVQSIHLTIHSSCNRVVVVTGRQFGGLRRK